MMGMYTQLHFAGNVKEDSPEKVFEILNFLINETTEPEELPNHPFFSCDRWKWIAKMDSYYFNYKTHAVFFHDEIGNYWRLNITSNLKNYSGEINKFIDWISPYCDALKGEFVGYSRYEEFDKPTIIYYQSDKPSEEL